MKTFQRVLFSAVITAGCAFQSPAMACLNDGSDEPLELLRADFVHALTTRNNKAYWQEVADKWASRNITASWQAKNDYAVALAHLGDYEKSFHLLEDAEKSQPGQYRTAANLGTLHELQGRNQEALKWIQEGIKRNPKSHQGSEWLHVRILQAKIALEKDSQWLHTNSVTGLDFGNGDKPNIPKTLPAGNDAKPQTTQQVTDSLVYQLHERLEFTPQRDALVADLLFDLGNLVVLYQDDKSARPIYKMAWNYGPTHAELVKLRLEKAGGRTGLHPALVILILGAVSAFAVLKFRAKRKI